VSSVESKKNSILVPNAIIIHSK